MANLIPENIQKLLSTYTFDVDPDCIIEDIKCIICKNLPNDSYQTFCDCKFCHSCILSYINDANEYCPGGKEECREEKLVLDRNVCRSALLNKKVMWVRVLCPNESCQFTSALAQMEDHLRVCSCQTMECPFTMIGCANISVNRNSVETHLGRDMLAHSQMLMVVVDNLKKEVGGLKKELRDNKLEIASFKEDFKLKEREIREEEKVMGQEERAIFNAVLEDLKSEVAALRGQMECAEENQQRLRELEEGVKELRKEIETKMEDSRKMISEVEALKMEIGTERDESRKLRGEVEALKMEIGTEREESRNMRAEIEVLRGDMQKFVDANVRLEEEKNKVKEKETKEEATGIIGRRVYELTDAVNYLNKRINDGVIVGSLWFMVDGINEMLRKGGKIDSPPFYSHVYGYKLRIRVHTSDLYLKVSSVLCKGENDDILLWPAYGLSVSVSLIDQHTKEAHCSGKDTFNFRDSNGEVLSESINWIDLYNIATLTRFIVSDSILLLATADY